MSSDRCISRPAPGRRPGIRTITIAALATLVASLATSGVATAATSAPSNDNQADAQTIHNLPAAIAGTTVGATTEGGPADAESRCGSTTASVWYTLRSATAQRVAVNLAASGALEATVDVYHLVRSQLNSVACERTEAKGKTALSFNASKNGVYLIRVAAITGSQLAPFTLEVFLPTPAIRPPGSPLPSGGVSGHVDPIQNVNAAYSLTLRSGVSYLINLANGHGGGCVDGRLYPPGTRSFEEGSPAVLHINCRGYRLFTPGPGQGGRYSFEVTPRRSRRQTLSPAGRARQHVRDGSGARAGQLRARARTSRRRGVQVLRLYRMDITSHSNLTLRLHAPTSADFNLQLRNLNGQRDRMSRAAAAARRRCSSSSSRAATTPSSRCTTTARATSRSCASRARSPRTRLSFGAATAHAGQRSAIAVKVSPASLGPGDRRRRALRPGLRLAVRPRVPCRRARRCRDRGVHPAGGRALAREGVLRRLAHVQPERRRVLLPAGLLSL